LTPKLYEYQSITFIALCLRKRLIVGENN